MQEFLKAGLISESHSPYAAPAILVKKKDGSYRFVVDYKKLNLITIKDSSPLPNMEDTIRKLGQCYNYFSKLDLKSGFYQIPINNADKAKTAFVTPFGLYQFNVLPMGLKNSPPTFQKVMTDTLKSCRKFSLVYLDDIIVFSKSFDEHLYHLERVLLALQTKHLILNPPKCVFATNQIDYLGHTISQRHITPMKEKIEAILQIKEPRSLAQANKFIGALSWYRKFIPHFATIAAPIHAVTNLTKDKRHKFKWNYAQSKAFHDLKRMLITEPLFLHYPVEDVSLMLTTDASGIGIGGVLQQEVNGEVHNLYYHSQLMTPCERKYSAIEKEALAIYKCFARMRTFMLGRNIILRTDHCPLCHIMEKTVRNARVDRITHLIQEFNIDKKFGHLRPISPPEGPFLLIGIDFCGPLKRTPRENQYVLVITDYFTRHVTAIALPNCAAETTAQALFNEYFCKYGIPAVILSDQGSHFRNQLMDNIKHLIGYNHIYSTPYHPQTNGIVERFNATFIPQISKLQDTQNNNWDEYLQAVVFAYNTGIHKTTKYSPYELLYGHLPRLPITIRPAHFSFAKPNDYFEQLKKTLRIYHQAAKEHIVLQQGNSKNVYDNNRLNPQYKIGDKVLTRIHGNRGKLDPKFSPIPKVIIQVNHPTYVVQDEETHVSSQVHVADLRPILIA
ncbi:unnamed protein product [Rotaria magnacalcarata]|nr:unnamed protein product [Rotaria magnacalcarata]